jgi:HupE / UreJ protein
LGGIIELSATLLALPNLWNRRAGALLFAVCAFGWPARVAAHDIPADSTVRMFVRPDGQRLHVLVRVQMASINDIDWPLNRPTGYLDLSRVEPFLRDASTMWISDYLDVFESARKLPYPTLTSVRLSTEGDTSFATYEDALAHVTGPRLPETTSMLSNQGVLDALFDYTIQSDQSRFSVHPRFDRFGLRVVTILRFVAPDGTIRGFEYEGGDPGLLRLDPEWHQTAATFAGMGVRYLLGAVDALLFLTCLVLPFRRIGAAALIATAFAAAYSITLVASAYGMAPGASWFPPFVVTLIAASIIYEAIDNVIGLGGAAFRRRWIGAFAAGLVYGFGFSFALGQSLQFAGSHLLTSVLSFNAGIALGQLFVLALLIPVLSLLFRFVVAERLGTIVLSALAAHTGWHWLTTRVSQLWRYQFVWPELTPAFFAGVLRWMMLVVAVAGVWWIGSLLLKSTRLSRSSTP